MTVTPQSISKPELVCPAGSLPALKLAVDHGADCVYLGFKDATNARNFSGLNFTEETIAQGIQYAQRRGCRVLVALNTFVQPGRAELWKAAVDKAANASVNALILADPSLMAYASSKYPSLALHLSVQGSATNADAIRFYQENFGVVRAVLPRVLTLTQVAHLVDEVDIELEVFGFGSLCVMVEGRCALSSYVTGESPNKDGVCSPAKAVRWKEHDNHLNAYLNDVLIDSFDVDESAGYPTLCKGRFAVQDEVYYAIEEPTSLNTLEILPQLMKLGIAAIKIEGRQRSPAYVEQVTKVWRSAIDGCYEDIQRYSVRSQWAHSLAHLSEGQQQTLGAYSRPWK